MDTNWNYDETSFIIAEKLKGEVKLLLKIWSIDRF